MRTDGRVFVGAVIAMGVGLAPLVIARLEAARRRARIADAAIWRRGRGMLRSQDGSDAETAREGHEREPDAVRCGSPNRGISRSYDP